MSLPPPTAVTVQAGIATAISLGSFNDGAGAGPYSVTVQWGDNSSPTTFSLPIDGLAGIAEPYLYESRHRHDHGDRHRCERRRE